MKQIISITDLATILNLINEKITMLNDWADRVMVLGISEREKTKKRRKEELKKDPFYNSLLHAKKALEECNIEIEGPDLEVQK